MKGIISAAVSIALTAAMTVSAFGAEIEITKASISDSGTVTAEVTVTDPAEAAQYSVIVMKKDDSGSYDFDSTVYINQFAEGEYTETTGGISFTINFAPEETGSYVLKVGAAEQLAPDEYDLSGESSDTPVTPDEPVTEGLYGDADLSGILTANDAACVLESVIDSNYQVEAELEIVDVDGDGELTAADAAQILSKVLDISKKFPIEE
ncbi:MAG: dockerin type I repeat-containing protein [Clostridiales bacterium]|nr:dockerin type I repeat-containing protein [Clostridiales bacterium]